MREQAGNIAVNLTPDIEADGATAPDATAPSQSSSVDPVVLDPIPPAQDQDEIKILRDTISELTSRMKAWEEAGGKPHTQKALDKLLSQRRTFPP
jgi:hypothetical protein